MGSSTHNAPFVYVFFFFFYLFPLTEPVLGSAQAVRTLPLWFSLWSANACTTLPSLPPPKTFKPKHRLPVLSDYSNGAPASFWRDFPSYYVQPGVSLINPDTLRTLGLQTGFPDHGLLHSICLDLRLGARIGCTGKFRLPSRATNAPSALEEGHKVTDAVADWTFKGFAFGPVPLNAVPDSAKFSGLMARPKPNGAVRVILNLSSPKGCSVNEGINSEEFPTVMSSTTQWLSALNKAGKRCFFLKVDWADAYKHIPVCREDSDLQWFTWLGKAFKELSLVFGGASSAGLFDRVAKVVQPHPFL